MRCSAASAADVEDTGSNRCSSVSDARVAGVEVSSQFADQHRVRAGPRHFVELVQRDPSPRPRRHGGVSGRGSSKHEFDHDVMLASLRRIEVFRDRERLEHLDLDAEFFE